MQKSLSNQGCNAVRSTSGTELIDRVQYLLDRSLEMERIAEAKLEKVAIQGTPVQDGKSSEDPPAAPPYFEDVFNRLSELKGVLTRIEGLILRVDL